MGTENVGAQVNVYHVFPRLLLSYTDLVSSLNIYIYVTLNIFAVDLIYFIKFYFTKCACETQMPPIMSNSKDGQGHEDK